jgi:hypothetical protein
MSCLPFAGFVHAVFRISAARESWNRGTPRIRLAFVRERRLVRHASLVAEAAVEMEDDPDRVRDGVVTGRITPVNRCPPRAGPNLRHVSGRPCVARPRALARQARQPDLGMTRSRISPRNLFLRGRVSAISIRARASMLMPKTARCPPRHTNRVMSDGSGSLGPDSPDRIGLSRLVILRRSY